MRLAMILGATAVAAIAAGGAPAQRVVRQGPGIPAARPMPPAPPPIPAAANAPGRWGGQLDGRWWGGSTAPGGWPAYRAPARGWALPPYWTGPRFAIPDWRVYGLPQPPVGYRWTRYYDDAVLIDERGSVWDSIGHVAWDGYDPDPYGTPPVTRPVPPPTATGYGADYPAPYAGYAPDYPVAPPSPPPPPPRHLLPPPATWTSPDGRTSVTTTTAGGYAAGGYYYPGGSTTTVTVQNAPVVTTTTTEIMQDEVTYSRPVRRTKRGTRHRRAR